MLQLSGLWHHSSCCRTTLPEQCHRHSTTNKAFHYIYPLFHIKLNHISYYDFLCNKWYIYQSMDGYTSHKPHINDILRNQENTNKSVSETGNSNLKKQKQRKSWIIATKSKLNFWVMSILYNFIMKLNVADKIESLWPID